MKKCIRILLSAIALSPPLLQAQWVQKGLSNRAIAKMSVGSSVWFTVTSDSGSVFRSANGGSNWAQVLASGAYDIAVTPNGTAFAAVGSNEVRVRGDSLCRSTDGGVTWVNQISTEIYSVAVGPTGWAFCGLNMGGTGPGGGTSFGVSTDNGSTWTFREPQGSNDLLGGWAFVFGSHSVITWGDWSGGGPGHTIGVSISLDDGRTWQRHGSLCGLPMAWCSNGNIYYGDLCLSPDTLNTSRLIGRMNVSALLALPSGGVLVGTDTMGIFLFGDNGDSLGTRNEELTDLHIHTLAMDTAGYVYAGTNAGVWRRHVSQLVVSVNKLSSALPQHCSLDQNFPNPFNPETQIQYSVPRSSTVNLRIFDLLGRQVAVLVNEQKPAGRYTVKWDASRMVSGIYFYRLQAGAFRETKRMVLIK
jgi:hypothetical protein